MPWVTAGVERHGLRSTARDLGADRCQRLLKLREIPQWRGGTKRRGEVDKAGDQQGRNDRRDHHTSASPGGVNDSGRDQNRAAAR